MGLSPHGPLCQGKSCHKLGECIDGSKRKGRFGTRRQRSNKDKDKDLFIGPQEFVVGYSKAPEQPQSSARPICHSHTMTRTGREPATVRIAA